MYCSSDKGSYAAFLRSQYQEAQQSVQSICRNALDSYMANNCADFDRRICPLIVSRIVELDRLSQYCLHGEIFMNIAILHYVRQNVTVPNLGAGRQPH